MHSIIQLLTFACRYSLGFFFVPSRCHSTSYISVLKRETFLLLFTFPKASCTMSTSLAPFQWELEPSKSQIVSILTLLVYLTKTPKVSFLIINTKSSTKNDVIFIPKYKSRRIQCDQTVALTRIHSATNNKHPSQHFKYHVIQTGKSFNFLIYNFYISAQ